MVQAKGHKTLWKGSESKYFRLCRPQFSVPTAQLCHWGGRGSCGTLRPTEVAVFQGHSVRVAWTGVRQSAGGGSGRPTHHASQAPGTSSRPPSPGPLPAVGHYRAVRLPGFSAGGIESIARSALSRVFPSARASRGQSKSLHVSTVHSFLLLNHIPLSGWIQHNSFIHSPVCSHSGGFLFSVATNKVALSTCHCIGHMLSFLLVKHPGVRWLGRIVKIYLIFQESYY